MPAEVALKILEVQLRTSHKRLNSTRKHSIVAAMTVTADEKKRVILPSARPGDTFDVQLTGEGKVVLTRLERAQPEPAQVTVEKRGRFSVGVLKRPIDEEALKEALAEFP